MATFARLVLASSNAGKLREFRRLLAPLGIDVVAQAELGIAEADEPHVTFVENALAKARHASALAGLPALADDSGVCVEALGGAPGVQSARYAGEPRSDARNNEKLIAELAGVADRRAHYYCVLVLVRHADDPEPIIAEGRWHGTIVDAPRGSGGFGYDPHFLDAETGLTGAELPLGAEERAVASRPGDARADRAPRARTREHAGCRDRPSIAPPSAPRFAALPPLVALRAHSVVPEEVPVLRLQLARGARRDCRRRATSTR